MGKGALTRMGEGALHACVLEGHDANAHARRLVPAWICGMAAVGVVGNDWDGWRYH